MAKTTTTKPAKTAAKPKAAPKTTAKAGDNAHTQAIDQAALEGATGGHAKADAVKALAKAAQERAAGDVEETRFAVAKGQSIRKGGVTYRGDQGDYIDLGPADAERFKASGHVIELDDVEEDDGEGDDEGSTPPQNPAGTAGAGADETK